MKLLIGTPMYGGQCSGAYTDSMIRLYDYFARNKGTTLSHRFLYGSSLIPTARNKIANEVIDDIKTDYLMFIDADIGFEPHDVGALLNAAFMREGATVVGGIYLRKRINWGRVAGAVVTNVPVGELSARSSSVVGNTLDHKEAIIGDPPFQADYIGAGFMMISRGALQVYRRAYPEKVYGEGRDTAFFDPEIDNDQYVSEDVAFCRRMRRAGVDVWCYPNVFVRHVGTHVYGEELTEN